MRMQKRRIAEVERRVGSWIDDIPRRRTPLTRYTLPFADVSNSSAVSVDKSTIILEAACPSSSSSNFIQDCPRA